MKGFYKVEDLEEHGLDCIKFKPQRVKMSEKKYLEFSSFRKTVKHPFYIGKHKDNYSSLIKFVRNCQF